MEAKDYILKYDQSIRDTWEIVDLIYQHQPELLPQILPLGISLETYKESYYYYLAASDSYLRESESPPPVASGGVHGTITFIAGSVLIITIVAVIGYNLAIYQNVKNARDDNKFKMDLIGRVEDYLAKGGDGRVIVQILKDAGQTTKKTAFSLLGIDIKPLTVLLFGLAGFGAYKFAKDGF